HGNGEGEARRRDDSEFSTHHKSARDGSQLFYLAPDRNLMAVEVKPRGNAFDHGAPHALFRFAFNLFARPQLFRYAVSSEGKRFLVSAEPPQPIEVPPLTVVVNWQAAGKR